MKREQLPINSTLHNNIIVRPVSFWILLNFLAACACGPDPDDKHDHYHFDKLFIFMACSTLAILAITGIVLLRKVKLEITAERIVFRNFSGKVRHNYLLSELVDFQWGNRPSRVNTFRYRGTTSIKNEHIELFFKDGHQQVIYFDDYGNFDRIKKFLFRYCRNNGIISIRPLEERKK